MASRQLLANHFQLAWQVALCAEESRKEPVAVKQLAAIVRIVRLSGNERFAQRGSFAMTLYRPRQIAEMRDRRRVLHRSQFFISPRELALQFSIAGRILGQTVEILQTSLHDQRASRRRTR